MRLLGAQVFWNVEKSVALQVNASASVTVTVAATGVNFGLEWPGDGAVRRMLFWHNPFPIYDATCIFKVYPRKKSSRRTPPTATKRRLGGNEGSFIWDGGNANTFYGAHPYPIPAPNGPGQREISVAANDFGTRSEVQWDRWYIQAFRAWRESATITHHEFLLGLAGYVQGHQACGQRFFLGRQNPAHAGDCDGASAPSERGILGRVSGVGRIQRHHSRHSVLLRIAYGRGDPVGNRNSYLHASWPEPDLVSQLESSPERCDGQERHRHPAQSVLGRNSRIGVG